MSINIGIFDNRKALNVKNGPMTYVTILDEKYICEQKINFDLILINLDDFTDNDVKFKGITALYNLRLDRMVGCPVICYGFQSLSKLLRFYQDFFILYAPKNSYLQLPFNLTEAFQLFQNLRLESKDRNIFESYPKYITQAQNEVKLIHQDANIYALNKTARSWYNFKGSPKPIWFKEKFKNFGRYDIASISSEFVFQKDPNFSSEDFNHLNAELTAIKLKLERLVNKKIIYIDDMADSGWANFFRELLENIALKVISTFYSLDDVFNQIQNDIQYSASADTIIFLDLRLFNEIGNIDIQELSGYKLLKRIKIINPTIPIIIISATNNKKNISYLLQSGAFFVWNKEGIQNRLSDFNYRERIHKLLQSVFNAYNSYANDADRFVFRVDFFIRILQNGANQRELKKKFYAFRSSNELIIDANAFVDIDYTVLLNTYFSIELFINEGKKITLINDVYYELLKFSMWDNISISAKDLRKSKSDILPNTIWCAKYAIEYLNLKTTKGQIDVKSKATSRGVIESGFFPYLNNIYADPKIVEYCNNARNPVLLLAKDNDLIDQIINPNVKILNFRRYNNLIWNNKFIIDYFTNVEW